MAILDWPDGLNIRAYDWTLDRPAQVNRSDYTGARRVAANPWHGRWMSKLELAPIVGNGRALRAFIGSLKGQVNSVRVPATEGDQEKLPVTTVSVTAAMGATTMTVAGALLEPGHLATVNDQLILITAAVDYLITFEPPLRAAATAATVIEVGNPTCLMALADSMTGWSAEPGVVYGSSFDFEEVF